jgi:hypothetical protein
MYNKSGRILMHIAPNKRFFKGIIYDNRVMATFTIFNTNGLLTYEFEKGHFFTGHAHENVTISHCFFKFKKLFNGIPSQLLLENRFPEVTFGEKLSHTISDYIPLGTIIKRKNK